MLSSQGATNGVGRGGRARFQGGAKPSRAFPKMKSSALRTKQRIRRTASASGEAVDDKGVTMLNNTEELEAMLATAKAEKRKFVLNVSSSKCGPCKLLLPTLQAYAEKYPEVSFARFYFDSDDSLRALVKDWSVQGVPSYRLYDEKGEMTKQFATGTPTKLGNTLYLFLS
jgi:thiol-disulfide isomerase/thioredoxin